MSAVGSVVSAEIAQEKTRRLVHAAAARDTRQRGHALAEGVECAARQALELGPVLRAAVARRAEDAPDRVRREHDAHYFAGPRFTSRVRDGLPVAVSE